VSLNGAETPSSGRSVAPKITTQTLENSRMTQTNLEIVGSARFFSSLLARQPNQLSVFAQTD
jgi:hypothetical protein